MLITGASSGLRVGFARVCAAAGAALALAARREDRITALAEELRAQGTIVLTRRTDVASQEDCEALTAATAAEFGRIDVLVNNADLGHSGAALREDGEVDRRVIEVNLDGDYWMARSCAPHMPWGLLGGQRVQRPRSPGLALPPGGVRREQGRVIGLTRDLAQQWGGGKGIRVTALCPGYFGSDR